MATGSAGLRCATAALLLLPLATIPTHAAPITATQQPPCPHLPAEISKLRYVKADALGFCATFMAARRRGLNGSSLVVDVGTAEWAAEALIARGFGHPVLTFECRGQVAERHVKSARFARDPDLKLVHSCVADRVGLGTLQRAADSSSMSKDAVEAQGASWKARREQRSGVTTESVPVITLDDALAAHSLAGLGWAHAERLKVGFIKVDVQGLEEPVLRGAIGIIRTHAPFLFYEDSMLPLADQKGALIARLLRAGAGHNATSTSASTSTSTSSAAAPPGGGGAGGGARRRQRQLQRQLRYECECDNDCFCAPANTAVEAEGGRIPRRKAGLARLATGR